MAKDLKFTKEILDNGLTLVVVEEENSPTVTVTTIYKVGSKNEHPEHTGFAHLFEHLMFGGSKNITNFDKELEKIGGSCNAFTAQDYTNYYTRALASNLEVLLWLESDRMLELKLDQKRLDVQKGVVIEEFKERYLNSPYGDYWLEVYPLVFGENNAYGWHVIGKSLEDIKKSNLDDVRDFFYTFYRPDNAILAIAGGVDTKETIELVKKWYSDIPKAKKQSYEVGKPQPIKGIKTKTVYSDVPNDALGIFFNAPSVRDKDYFSFQILIEILGGRSTAVLPYTLVKEKELCISFGVDEFEHLDLNALCLTTTINSNANISQVEDEIWTILKKVSDLITQEELDRTINNKLFAKEYGLMTNLAKANMIAFYELIGDIDRINNFYDMYKKIKLNDVKDLANRIISEQNYAVLYYRAQNA
ncbi:MAG: peptidase M16 [Candidatus Dojkabacteria bacterium]|nr:MAG: peptidase M16 [Candidatus Dojkabacteria bacterium]